MDGPPLWHHRDVVPLDLLQKFWSEQTWRTRSDLLRIDKQTFFEQARRNFYCSRCHGMLLDNYTEIVLYGKSPHGKSRRLEEMKDPSAHQWGGLTTTKDGMLTLLDCFINAQSWRTLQSVFNHAHTQEQDREMLSSDACGWEGRGWISQGMVSYGRGHGVRESCSLHTARLSCDTLVDLWSTLSAESRSLLLRMKEEDFIERLMYRFDSKRFCRDCRKNVIREFKELKEWKRMRRQHRCTIWFCVADTAFEYELSDDTVILDWSRTFGETNGSYQHFEWAMGTEEGLSDIVEFQDVGLNGKAQMGGLDLLPYNACFITLRAWKVDGHCSELSVKAYALDAQPCVHRRLVVGDGYVSITKGESIRSFFEHAEDTEEEDDDDTLGDGNDFDSHMQKHAKSPELAREFLIDAATVIFKEQIEKACREGTARQNARCIFISLALNLLEERVHVACKDIATLEKQSKLLEEEEREKREVEERKERKRLKEKEKKLRRKERFKEKERERERKLASSKQSNEYLPTESAKTCLVDESMIIPNSRDLVSADEDQDGLSLYEASEDRCQEESKLPSGDGHVFEASTMRQMRYAKEHSEEHNTTYWQKHCQDELEGTKDSVAQAREAFTKISRVRNNYRIDSCRCGHMEEHQAKYNPSGLSAARSVKEMRTSRRTPFVGDKPRSLYRGANYTNGYHTGRTTTQVWEPTDAGRKSLAGLADAYSESKSDSGTSEPAELDYSVTLCKTREYERCQNMGDVYSDQKCEGTNKIAAAAAIESSYVKCEGSMLPNFSTSDGSSSLSEGDSNAFSSGVQNSESSSTSDSEEYTEREKNSIGHLPAHPANSSPATCAEKPTKRDQLMIPGNSNIDRLGYALEQHKPQVPLAIPASFSPPATSSNEHSACHWHSHFGYPGPVGYGIPVNQISDFWRHENNENMLRGSFVPKSLQPLHLPYRSMHYRTGESGGGQHANVSAASAIVARKISSVGNESEPFSLFHFGLPSEVPLPRSVAPPPKACSTEEMKMEYNLFSARSGGMFSFLH